MKFKYKNFGKNIWKPVIPVVLRNGNQEIEYNVLLDSGADMCLGHAEVGKAIGIAVTSGAKYEFGGITGPGIAYKHYLEIEIGGYKIPDIEFSFSADLPLNYSFGVLGHKGFFEHFRVIFETSKKLVELKPIKQQL